MDLYKRWLRPFFFRLDPETAHHLAGTVLKHPFLGRVIGADGLVVQNRRLQVRLGGVNLGNPVGLAPGFDKDCEMLASLDRLGFGYLVAGSVMCDKRPGNPRPRMIRLPEQNAIMSCMGLSSKGLDYVSARLRKYQKRRAPLFVNCNGFHLPEYLRLVEVLQPLVDGIELSLSCANENEAGGDFLDPRFAEQLFVEVAKRKNKPVFIKIPGYVSEADRQKRLELIELAMRYSIDGLTISVSPRIEEKRISTGYGSLSGQPLFPEMLRVVKDAYRVTKGRCHIKARGGIFSAEDAFEAIAAGGSTVEIFSSFIYEGWSVARGINQGLLDLLDRHHLDTVESLRGTQSG